MVNINPQWPILGFISRLIRICRLSGSSDSLWTVKLWAGRALYITQVAWLTQQSRPQCSAGRCPPHTYSIFLDFIFAGVVILDAFFNIYKDKPFLALYSCVRMALKKKGSWKSRRLRPPAYQHCSLWVIS